METIIESKEKFFIKKYLQIEFVVNFLCSIFHRLMSRDGQIHLKQFLIKIFIFIRVLQVSYLLIINTKSNLIFYHIHISHISLFIQKCCSYVARRNTSTTKFCFVSTENAENQ